MKPQKGSVLVLILSGLALIFAAGLAYFYYQNQTLKGQPVNVGNYSKTIPDIKPPEVKPADQTANWKTFTDALDRFSFKYPDTLAVSTAGFVGGSGTIQTQKYDYSYPKQGYKIEMQVSPGAKSFDDNIKLACISGMTGEKKAGCQTSVLTTYGYKVTAVDYGNGAKTYFLSGNTVSVALIVFNPYDPKYRDTLDQILSTFKFLEPTSLDANFKGTHLTAGDNGKTFTHVVTSRFDVALDKKVYPLSDWKCTPSEVVGWPVSNWSINGPDNYPLGFEASQEGSCLLSNHDFSVTINVIKHPTDQ